MSASAVLAAMDGARRIISAQSKLSDDVMAHIADDVAQARAAVAELIEAAEMMADLMPDSELETDDVQGAIVRRLRTALARCTGAGA